MDKHTNLENFAKKVNDKYRVNRAIHEFNKAIIENDYYTNVRHIIGGGMYTNSAISRSRKDLSSNCCHFDSY